MKVWPFLILCIVAMPCSAYADTLGCADIAFQTDIQHLVSGRKSAPILRVNVSGKVGVRMALDTGFSRSLLFSEDNPSNENSTELYDETLSFIPQLGRSINLFRAALRAEVRKAARERGFEGIINPQLIYPDGYTVLDLKDWRIVGFKNESSLRRCYQPGLVVHKTSAETTDNVLGVPVTLDGRVSGRAFVDTGAFISEFYSPLLAYTDAHTAKEFGFWTATAEYVSPQVSAGHKVQVGDKVKSLERIVVATPDRVSASSADLASDYIALLGYDALIGSILIFPPASHGGWEIIF
ncbi:MAG: hypothetical protein IPK59_08200 [Rhodospirillaceae bacterium]|nr:hypothetical protein [Rhodospirillaceae bacterium]